jgi:deaminated glutathione amidase
MKVAAVQTIASTDVTHNLARAAALIERAAQRGAQLVLLPEYFCLMGKSDGDKVRIAEKPGDGPVQRFLAESARKHGVWLLGGTVPLQHPDGDKVWNSLLTFDPQGKQIARYDKIHLFRFTKGNESYDEARTIGAGAQPTAVQCGPLKVGLSICYDLRFPELYRRLGALDLIVVPAAFTYTTGKAHWHTLLAARAIENQCYVLAAGQGGLHENGRRTWGHSMLIDPWGAVLDDLPEGEGVAIGQIDSAKIAAVRESLPALSHRVM